MESADRYFALRGQAKGRSESRSQLFTGALGVLRLSVRMDGGHYTVVEAYTDQVGESRLDKNVKQFFVVLHRQADARRRVEAGY